MSTINAPEHVIDLAHVAKTYRGKIPALRGIEMRVRRGEVFGLLGPNGAGKSTLVKILMTVIRPSKCKGTLLGEPVGRKGTLARVGYLPEHHRFPGHLKGWQVLDFYGAMGGVERRERRKRIDGLLELVGMTDWRTTPVRRYSKGMRQRVGIAQALMNDPALVLLDEPTDGVDPQGRRDIRDICARLRDEGRTVFINSHLLSELEMVCDRVAILVQGLVRSQGTLTELTEGQRYYEIALDGSAEDAQRAISEALPPGVATAPDGVIDGAMPTGEWVRVDAGRLRIGTDDAGLMQPILRSLVSRGAAVRSMGSHRPSLEDLFLQAVKDDAGNELGPGAAKRPNNKRERTSS
ncbi:MAG: ABC transporter ATP-binding protein [Phycisphaerae bacterium]|nr:ABC transporter ATP-binding protein [Phycisphaerae bacterium]